MAGGKGRRLDMRSSRTHPVGKLVWSKSNCSLVSVSLLLVVELIP